MATDWAADVKKYDAKADDAAIAGLVRYCGIALRNRDSALVSFSDKAETDRVRTNFLKKKLGLTQADSVLDAAIAKVGVQMKADRTKNRVTVYYLLASEFKALGQFIKAAPAAKKAPAAKAAPAKVAAAKTTPPKVAAKSAPAKSATATKATSIAAVVAGAAAAKAKPAKKPPAAKTSAAPMKKVAAAAPAKAAAPVKKAAPPKKAAAPAKATTAKAAAPTANATQGLLDKAANTASDAVKAVPKAAVAAAAGTAAAVGAIATGAASLAKDTATSAPAPVSNAASAAAGKASAAESKASAIAADGGKPATSAADDDGSEINWLWWVIGLLVIAVVAWFVFGRGPDADDANAAEGAASAAASDVGTDLAAAVPEGNAAIPAGAGVTSEMRDGKPVVKVYFDSGMTAVTPDFAKTAGGLKSWLVNHSGATLAVSGYSDPSGNAAQNAELAKQRAQAVQSALTAADIPATSARLEKPAEVSDATVAKEAARRVEVVVK